MTFPSAGSSVTLSGSSDTVNLDGQSGDDIDLTITGGASGNCVYACTRREFGNKLVSRLVAPGTARGE